MNSGEKIGVRELLASNLGPQTHSRQWVKIHWPPLKARELPSAYRAQPQP